ncbi:MAG: peptidoglycan DD-metalloendopeptidase family protein [Okeania sp. SIO2H7]|nr:peptidoglycan DD-metalloendopeptidase family protein [Okeania sp. SIO2H7]
MPAGFVEVELERDRINTSTEVAYESPMTAKAEGAVVIDSDRIEAPVSTLYEIQPGDTLGVIASRHGVSVEELVELNNLGDPDWLQVNDTLKIPQKRSQTYGQILKDSAGAYDSTKANSQPKTLSLNESTDYGFTLPTPETQRTSIEGFQSVSFPKQGSPYLAQKIELKEKFRDGLAPLMLRVDPATTAGQFLSGAVEAPEVEGFGQSSPINLRPTSTENLEREDASESSQQNPGNDSYSQRLRAEIRRLRQEYEFEQDSEAIANNWDSQPSANDTESEGLEPSLNHSPTTTEFDSNDPIQWRRPEISSPNNREVLERMSPRRQEIYPLQPFSSPKQRQAEESTLVGSTSFKAQEILNFSLGEMVSPDLPPLEGADTYLPGGSMEFTGYIWPAKGTLTSGYGWRWGRMHRGIDIAAPTGTPIMAAAPGVVSFAGWNSGYGYLVEIKHPDESLTLYAHNSQILVQEGQAVAQGELIAKMGSTGRSTGPHLHFEIHPTGDGASNPIAYLPSVRASR